MGEVKAERKENKWEETSRTRAQNTYKRQHAFVLPDGPAAAAERQQCNSAAARDQQVRGHLVQLVVSYGRHIASTEVRDQQPDSHA